jgi:hypothetical protein
MPDPASGAPETLGTLIADAASLPEEARVRIHALEEGRHPPLDALREALGGSIDVDAAVAAATQVLAGGGAEHTPIAEALDAAYRALHAPKLVRAEITASSIRCWRDPESIAATDGEPLLLVVVADNRTDATVEFSAESHGEGFGGFVEAHRTGSSILDLGTMPVGRYLVPLLVVADGRAHTVDLPIVCTAVR